MRLGNTITELRKQKGLKQKQLASDCGISAAYLSQIERERKRPNLSVLESISSEMNVPLPILFMMSLSEEDVPEEKRDMFRAIAPAIRNLVDSLVNEGNVKGDK